MACDANDEESDDGDEQNGDFAESLDGGHADGRRRLAVHHLQVHVASDGVIGGESVGGEARKVRCLAEEGSGGGVGAEADHAADDDGDEQQLGGAQPKLRTRGLIECEHVQAMEDEQLGDKDAAEFDRK